MAPEVHEKLSHYQTLVVKQLTVKSNDNGDQSEANIGAQLSENLHEIKSLVIKAKKN